MRRHRKSVLFLLIVVVCYFTVTEFMLEVFALAWHVRHGSTARVKAYAGKAYSLQVPTFWWAQVDDGGWNITLMKKPGRVRARLHEPEWAMMSFSVSPTYSTAEEIGRAAPILKSKGLSTTELA